MKPLSQMTRDELWALDEKQVIDLALTHRLRVYMQGIQIDKEDLLEDLEELRLELQQDSADSRQDR